MFNAATIQSEFLGLVGARKDSNPQATYQPIGDLLTSSTGIMLNDEHPLLTNDNLGSVCPQFTLFTYSAWSSGTTYVIGDIVTSASVYYVSIVNSNLANSVSDTDFWRVTTPYNEWLRQRILSSCLKVANDVLTLKMERLTADNLLKSQYLHGNVNDNPQPSSGLLAYAGFYILISPERDIACKLHKIGIHFASTPPATISLYRGGSDTAITAFAITPTGTYKQWIDVSDYDFEPGENYYLAYPVGSSEPLNDIYDEPQYPEYWTGCMPFIRVSGFTHAGPGETGWSMAGYDRRITNDNLGLDLEFSARCDYTNVLVSNKNLIAPALSKAIASSLLRELAFNASALINRGVENVDKQGLLYETDGDSQGRDRGMKKQYEDELKKITFDTNRICKYCLPKKLNKVSWQVT